MSDAARRMGVAASWEPVLSTDELNSRSTRSPDYEIESRALRAIARHMADSPQTALQKLVETALEICDAGSAGISIFSKEKEEFYWPAVAGAWKAHAGVRIPREFDPSSVVIQLDAAQLFTHFDPFYRSVAAFSPPVAEALLCPFYVHGKATGTVWVIAHDASRKFDAEDRRLIQSLGQLAAAVYPLSAASDAQEQQSRSMRNVNEQLLISSVHQHELTEQSQKAETVARASEERLAVDLAGMRRLHRLHARLAGEHDLNLALNEILAAACEFTGTGRGCIQLVSEDGERLEIVADRGYGPGDKFIEHFRHAGSKPVCDAARRERRRLIIEDVASFPPLEGTRDREVALADGIRATQSTPMTGRQGDLVGVLSNQFPTPHRPTEEELRLIDLLCWTAAEFVERHRAETALRESEERQVFLLQLSDALRPLASASDVTETACRLLTEHLNASRAQYTEVEGEPGAEIGTVRGEFVRAGESATGRFPPGAFGDSLIAVLRRGDTLALTDTDTDTSLNEAQRAAFRPVDSRAAISAPLMKENRLTAIFTIYNLTPRDWTNAEIDLVNEVAERTQAAVERAKVEEALRELDVRYRAMADTAPVLIWEIDESGAIFVNGHYLNFFGVTFEEVRGLGWAKFLHPDDAENYIAAYQTAFSQRQPYVYECRLLRADGEYRWLRTTGYPVGATRFVGCCVDVTETKRTQANLAFLNEVSQDLAHLTNIEATMNVLGEKIGRHFSAALCAFGEVDEKDQVVTVTHEWKRGDVPSWKGTHRISDFHTEEFRQACRSGEICVVRDTASDARTNAGQMAALSTGSLVSVPLVRGGDWRYEFAITDTNPRDWREDEVELMRELTTRIWTRLERARAEEALRESQLSLRGQKEAFEAAISGAPLIESLDIFVQTAIQQFGGEAQCGLYLADATGLELRHVTGMPEEYARCVDGFKVGPESLACGLAVHTGQPRLTADVREDPLWEPWLWLAEKFGYRGCWSFPVETSAGKMVGTLALYFRERREATSRDLELATFLTRAAGIIISRYQAAEEHDKATNALRESERRFREMIDALPAAVYTTDAQGRLTHFNPAAVELSGHVPELGTDHSCVTWKLYYPDGTPMPHDECPMAIALKEGRAMRGVEAIAERPDGTRVWFTPYPTPLRDGTGTIVGGINMLVDITERKRAEEARNRLAAIVESSEDAIISKDLSGIIQTWNAGAERLFGYTATEAIGQPITMLIPATHLDEEALILEHIKRGDSIEQYETVRKRKDGTLLNVSLTVSPIINESGHIAGASKIARDITERKRAEEARSRLAAIVESSDDAIVSKDLNGIIRTWNSGAERLFGYTAAEAIGQPVTMLIPATHLDEEPFILERIRRGQPVEHYETLRRRKDGTLLDVSLTVSPIVNEIGRVIGASKIARDITERKRAEESVRESAERLRFMAESMPQKIFTTVPSGDFDYFNRQWTDFTGLSFDQLRKGWTQFVHADDLEETIRLWRHSIDSGQLFQFVHRYQRADGAYRWHLSRAHAMRDAYGSISIWIGSNTDIHEEKEREEELQRLNTDLNQFAFAASHDFQEPLRMITSYSQLLLKGYRGELAGEAAVCVDYIAEGTKRMRELLADLLSYTEAGSNTEAATESIDLNLVFQKASQNLKAAIEETGATVTSDHLPAVQGREAHFLQLFQNLIGNAIKYRGKGRSPRVHLSAEQRNTEWLFAMSDNGMGIEPQYQQEIFGVFKRLHGKAIPGTGIGLAICQRVVERHGGRIWVESQVDQGSTFYYTLPRPRGGGG